MQQMQAAAVAAAAAAAAAPAGAGAGVAAANQLNNNALSTVSNEALLSLARLVDAGGGGMAELADPMLEPVYTAQARVLEKQKQKQKQQQQQQQRRRAAGSNRPAQAQKPTPLVREYAKVKGLFRNVLTLKELLATKRDLEAWESKVNDLTENQILQVNLRESESESESDVEITEEDYITMLSRFAQQKKELAAKRRVARAERRSAEAAADAEQRARLAAAAAAAEAAQRPFRSPYERREIATASPDFRPPSPKLQRPSHQRQRIALPDSDQAPLRLRSWLQDVAPPAPSDAVAGHCLLEPPPSSPSLSPPTGMGISVSPADPELKTDERVTTYLAKILRDLLQHCQYSVHIICPQSSWETPDLSTTMKQQMEQSTEPHSIVTPTVMPLPSPTHCEVFVT
eukprot:TRINITY_DN2253_c1_g1_i2.p1 TRINITY_DN2253_c1_g1~~TRINITY_DN2253_c1_g1_i2.p1  ORF type:complete len:400 (+),score=110.45 TRINITY_DN2253_c1_g1_i2:89-1288(+)